MKKIISIIALLFLAATLFYCGSKKDDSAASEEKATEESSDWKEMDEFHIVMAETFHPYKDSANLEPVKSKAGELYASAEKWSATTLPAEVDNEDMKGKLQELKTQTDSLRNMVQTGTEEQIGQQLTKVHDIFHEIQEAWYGGGEKHH